MMNNTISGMNRDSILAATDNGYSVFSYYLAPHYPGGRVEAGQNIQNPFLPVPQRTPSFNIYRDSSGVWRYKDFAHADCAGDCFDLAARMSGLSTRSQFPAVLQRIAEDIGIAPAERRQQHHGSHHHQPHHYGPQRTAQNSPQSAPQRPAYTVQPKGFSAAELRYWGTYGIGTEVLERFGVVSLASYTATRRNGECYTVTATPDSPMFAYRYGADAWKIYRPHEPKEGQRFRFIGTKPEDSVWGVEQLPDVCSTIILAAGEKDTLAAAAHGFTAVTLNSETARLGNSTLAMLQQRCSTVVCCYDTDQTGRSAAASLRDIYGIPTVHLPSWIADFEGKDLSDFFQMGGTAAEYAGQIAEAIARHPVAALPPRTDTSASEPAASTSQAVGGDSDLLETVDAESLLAMEFSEPEWVVERLLPPGLAILGGRPKHGKSWLAMNLAIATANGAFAFGMFPAAACETLYLALEDNNRRLQKRLKMILHAEQAKIPESLHFRTKFRRFDNGGFDDLRTYLTARPATRLVIIDTLAKLRGRQRGGKDTYAGDYQELGELQAIALEHKAAIVVVHHTTKMDFADPFDAISGTSGVAGAADTLLVLRRESGSVTLYTRGRDIDESEIAMSFNQTTGVWSAIGDAAEVRLSNERRKILDALGDGGVMTPKEIAEETGLPYDSIRHLCLKMRKVGMLEQKPKGKYAKPL